MRLGFALFAAFLALSASVLADDAQRIAAVVNDEVISTYDVAERITVVIRSSGVEATPESRERLRPQVLRALIDERLQLQEARRLDIAVTEADRKNSLQFLERQNNIPEGKLLDALAQRGIPEGSFLAQMDAQIAWTKVVQTRLRPTVIVTEGEVTDVLERLEASRGQPEYRLGEIFLAVDTPADEPEVQAAARRLTEEIQRGADFKALARQFSQSASAGVGGEMGWVLESRLPEEILAAIRGANQGEVVGPIATSGGYVLIRVLGLRKALEGGPEDEVVGLKLVIVPLPVGASAEAEDARRREAAALAAGIDGCESVEQAAAKVEAAQVRTINAMPASELTAEVKDAIRGVAVGDASAPVLAGGAFNVLVVCERTAQDVGPPTREEVRQGLYDQRLDLLARGYLRDLRRAAFVDVRA